MINLKLAEYNAQGKFERFLSLSKTTDFSIVMDGFLLGDDFIEITKNTLNYRTIFKKDKTDPLNRFNGRFNNRSYGNGRFVLIKDDEDDIFVDLWAEELKYGNGKKYKTYLIRSERLKYSGGDRFELIADLHQNPELWGKIK